MYLCISSFFHSSALQTQGFGVHKCLYTANSGQSIAALARQYGGLDAAAAALGFPSVQALQDAIQEFCEG